MVFRAKGNNNRMVSILLVELCLTFGACGNGQYSEGDASTASAKPAVAIQEADVNESATSALPDAPIPVNSNSAPPASSSATSGVTLPAGTVAPLNGDELAGYQSYFDAEYAKSIDRVISDINKGDSENAGYYMPYHLWPLMNMFIATADPKYLDNAMDLAERAVSMATIYDDDGHLNWGGNHNGDGDTRFRSDGQPVGYILTDTQAAQSLAWLALMIKQNPWVGSNLTQRAGNLYTFTKDQIIDKWFVTRGLTGYKYVLDFDPSDPGASSGGGKDHATNSLMAMIALNAYSPNATYQDWIDHMMPQAIKRLVPSQPHGGKSPMSGSKWWNSSGSVPDTAHSNRWPAMLMSSYLGIASGPNRVTDAQLVAFGKHFASMIYSGNPANGFSASSLGGAPYASSSYSIVYHGWFWLGAVSPDAQAVVKATADYLVSGNTVPANTIWFTDGGLVASYLANKAMAGQ